MRWFFGITKILVAALLLAAVIKLAYTFESVFKPINTVYERVKEFGVSGLITKTRDDDLLLSLFLQWCTPGFPDPSSLAPLIVRRDPFHEASRTGVPCHPVPFLSVYRLL